jgi:hypothetical protein
VGSFLRLPLRIRSTALKRCKGKLAPPVEYRSEIGSKARNNACQLVDKIRSSRKDWKKPLFSGQFFYMSVAPDQMPHGEGREAPALTACRLASQ